jgi:hypothetical protein
MRNESDTANGLRHEARDGTAHLGFTGTGTVTGNCYRLDSDGFNLFCCPYAGRVGFFKTLLRLLYMLIVITAKERRGDRTLWRMLETIEHLRGETDKGGKVGIPN